MVLRAVKNSSSAKCEEIKSSTFFRFLKTLTHTQKNILKDNINLWNRKLIHQQKHPQKKRNLLIYLLDLVTKIPLHLLNTPLFIERLSPASRVKNWNCKTSEIVNLNTKNSFVLNTRSFISERQVTGETTSADRAERRNNTSVNKRPSKIASKIEPLAKNCWESIIACVVSSNFFLSLLFYFGFFFLLTN